MRRVKKQTTFQLKWKIAGCVVLLMAGIIFYVSPPGQQARRACESVWDAVTDRAHLELKQVYVEGHARTDKDQVAQIMNVSLGMPMLDIDLDEARERVLTLPWVKTAVVERRLPSYLVVKITERQPIALWQHNKKYLPLDEDGVPVPDEKIVLPNLMLVTGADAPRHTPDLIRALDQFPAIREKVRSALRVGSRRWNLILNDAENGLVIELPETDIAAALQRLETANEQDKLLKRDLTKINVQSADRLVVTVKGGKAK